MKTENSNGSVAKIWQSKYAHKKPEDLTGRRFGQLEVITRGPMLESIVNGASVRYGVWICRCDCGQFATAVGGPLKRGKRTSCGCGKMDRCKLLKAISKTHGHTVSATPTREYHSWRAMKKRCLDTKHHAYKDYGGRGITICSRWLNSFENFLSDMGERPEGMCLERKDNNGNYDPQNCKWATEIEQKNNRRSNKIVEFNGQRRTVAQWERQIGLARGSLFGRLARWTIERALTTPPRPYCKSQPKEVEANTWQTSA